jgi:hypothetical protein
MYGMVNEALRTFLISEFGEEGWESARTAAGVEAATFLSMRSYPDSITYGLIGAASQAQGVEAAELLTAFGRSWISFAKANGYGALLGVAGDDFLEFLANLDTLHARLETSFPGYSAPSFRLDAPADGESFHTLHYYSKRGGLVPFVLGLLEGVATSLGAKVRLELLENRADHPVCSVSVDSAEEGASEA